MPTLKNTEITSIEASQMAYAAITTDGEVISWGDVNYGGNLDTSLSELSNVRELYSGFAGFLALTANDEYLYWGDEIVGVQLSEVSQDIENPQKIIGNYAAFAALNNDGSVVVWGDPTQGGAIYGDTLDAMTSGVIDLASTGVSFAALKFDGSVHAWGSEYFGGLLPEDLNADIVQLIGNEGDFTALSADGSVTSWGFSYGWGASNTNISVPSSSNFTKVFATSRAFAGIEEDGSVSAWGSVEHGGDASLVSDQLLDIVDITASRYTFVALNSNGELIAWGASDSAASSIPQTAEKNVVKVVAAQDAFAALKTDGSVVSWGDPDNGGDSSSVQELISSGVEDIYSNALSFIALKKNGTLVTWGESTAGADIDVVSSLVYVSEPPVTELGDDMNSVSTFSYSNGPLLAGVLAPNETISVYLHDLEDVDGITGAVFEYQWFADDAEIEGAVNSAYTITDQDVGKKIGVKITYQDDKGFSNTVYQKLDEAVVDESVSVFEVPILRYGATNGVPYFIGVETAKLRVRDDDSFSYVYDADYGAKVSSLGGMAVEYDGYVIPNFILEDRGISRSLTSDNQYFDAAYFHLDGIIPSMPETVVNGVSSLLIPLGASSDFLSLGLESGEESYNEFVSKIIQEVGVPDSEPYGPGKTNWLRQVASDLQSQWRAISQEDQTIVGTDADDNLLGGVGDDIITGGGGNDTLNGGAGNDILDGGEGDDEIYGGDGDDIIYTSAGNDIYDGGDGIDTVITDYINSPPTLGGSMSLRNIENQFFIGETSITIDRSLDPESGNNHVKSQSGDDRILLGVGDDTFELGAGKNYSGGGAGNDTIILSSDNKFTSSYVAKNISSSLQIGTEERINLNGKTRLEDVMDGGADADTVELTDASDAFFLHDSFSGFHSSLALSDDYAGELGKARIENIETINAGGGDDIVDLTSPDYSLAGQNITVNGGEGSDTLWGSDANETLKGENGDDVLFGGAGTNSLTGGEGADEFQFTRTSIADTVTDYDLSSGDKLRFFYESGSEEAEWSFSIQNGDLHWGENTIDFGTREVTALDDLSIFVEEIGSGQATQFEYVPDLGEEILRLDLYPELYEQDYYSKIVTDLQFAEFNDLATAIDADMTFLGGLNEVAVATGLEANGNGFSYSAGAVYNNTYNTVEISADITNFKIDGIAANPISLQALLEATTIASGEVGGLFNSITLSANSIDYLTLKHSANGLSLVYENATNGMINELRLDGNFNNDLNAVIPVVSDLLNFDFSDPIALLGSQEFLETSADLESLATLSGLSIMQKGVEDPYLQLTATDTTLNVAYKDWDIVVAIEVSETWQPDPDAFLSALQNLVTNSNDLDLSELSSLYQGAGSLSLSIIHDDAGKLAEGIIHDFGDLLGSLDRDAGDEVFFGTAVGDSYAIDSNGLAAVVFKEREFDEAQITELMDELDIRLESEGGSSSATVVSSASGYKIEDALTISLTNAGSQLDDLMSDVLFIA